MLFQVNLGPKKPRSVNSQFFYDLNLLSDTLLCVSSPYTYLFIGKVRTPDLAHGKPNSFHFDQQVLVLILIKI